MLDLALPAKAVWPCAWAGGQPSGLMDPFVASSPLMPGPAKPDKKGLGCFLLTKQFFQASSSAFHFACCLFPVAQVLSHRPAKRLLCLDHNLARWSASLFGSFSPQMLSPDCPSSLYTPQPPNSYSVLMPTLNSWWWLPVPCRPGPTSIRELDGHLYVQILRRFGELSQ